MGDRILVTGGAGLLGRQVVERLLNRGHDVRVMSRKPRPPGDDGRYGWAAADLRTGYGVADAVADVGAIVHCATAGSRGAEAQIARTLVDAANRNGRPHLLYVSIVGVDRVPFGYYQGKLAAERVIAESAPRYTIQRATQFHDLLRALFANAARSPLMPVPALRFQPVDASEVADRVADLATGEPAGRAPDLGGPEVREATELARAVLQVTGRRRRIVPVRLPGKAFRAFRDGGHLAPDHRDGTITFEDYLATHAAPAATSYRLAGT